MHERSQAEALAQEAHTHFEAGRWQDALKALDRALALDPDQSDWHFNRGLVLDALARHDEAAESFETALVLRGEEPDTELQLAISLLRSGRAPHRAAAVLQQLIARDRDEPTPHAYLIAAYAQLGDHEEAERAFYLGQQLFEESALSYDHMAHSLAMRGLWAQARRCWQRALELEPDHPTVPGELARAWWHLGDREQAHRAFAQQRELDPADAETALAHGSLLLEMGRTGEARETLEEAAARMPGHAIAHLRLGELWLDGEHWEAAEDHLMRALQIAPQTPALNLRLAQLERARGVREQARAFAFAELCVAGRDAHATLELAELLIELEMAGRAVVPLSRVLEEEPEGGVRARALWLRGTACFIGGDAARSVRDGRRAWAEPNAPRAAIAPLMVLGCIRLKRWREARVWLRRSRRHGTASPAAPRLRSRYWRARAAHALFGAPRAALAARWPRALTREAVR